MYASRAAGLTYMNAVAMGVGRDTWNRAPAGITPSSCKRAYRSKDSSAASAYPVGKSTVVGSTPGLKRMYDVSRSNWPSHWYRA